MNDQELLTASKAAEALNATSQTVRNWIRGGRVPAVRIGNRFLIPRAEVERLRGELPEIAVGESVWESDDSAPVIPLRAQSPERPAHTLTRPRSCSASEPRRGTGIR